MTFNLTCIKSNVLYIVLYACHGIQSFICSALRLHVLPDIEILNFSMCICYNFLNEISKIRDGTLLWKSPQRTYSNNLIENK